MVVASGALMSSGVLDEAREDSDRPEAELVETLERLDDRFSIARRAVVERNAFRDLECPLGLVFVRLPGVGQHRLVRERVASVEDEEHLVGAVIERGGVRVVG